MTNKEKGTLGYYKELAKEVRYPNKIEGFNVSPFLKWAIEQGILTNHTDIEHNVHLKTIEKNKCKTRKEYVDKCAQRAGFKDNAEKQKEWKHATERQFPKESNKDCSRYFGEFISQNYVMKTFEDPIPMPPNNPGYDWICKKGEKIDHKGSCLTHSKYQSPRLFFNIRYNNIAEWSILSAWDNIDSLNPLHIWIFHKNDIVRGRKFWRRDVFSIVNRPEYLRELEKYEVTDRLDKLKELCKMKM